MPHYFIKSRVMTNTFNNAEWLVKKKLEKNIKSDTFHTYFYRHDFSTYKK